MQRGGPTHSATPARRPQQQGQQQQHQGQQHQGQQRPATPSAQTRQPQQQQQHAPLAHRPATPTGGAAAGQHHSRGGSHAHEEEGYTWTSLKHLQTLIPSGLRSAPAVPPLAPGQPIPFKFAKLRIKR
ncbi:hypothetical protein C8A01DRAFT_42101 [Parachaetomium inaequale]|uniref:Uncharacterized protein n=1 Tax=Parachaetomium inaequale TaxID=2588326 RepID=A0AAN6SL89_9PEZI|nr:hypothetical protein C8A01DRAFT_42101 [Parachaetomium inaequale]